MNKRVWRRFRLSAHPPRRSPLSEPIQSTQIVDPPAALSNAVLLPPGGGDFWKFSWESSEQDGAQTYEVNVKAICSAELESTQTVRIIVLEKNKGPELGADRSTISLGPATENQQLQAALPLDFQNPGGPIATDSDDPENGLTYTIVNADPEMYNVPNAAHEPKIDENGNFIWTPSEVHGGNTYTFYVRATDRGGFSPFEDDVNVVRRVEVEVIEDQQPPVVESIGNVRVVDDFQQDYYKFRVKATDADEPRQTLTYTLVDNTVPKASIDNNTGIFTWNEYYATAPDQHTFKVRVTDSEGYSTGQTFNMTVDYENYYIPALDGVGDENSPHPCLTTYVISAGVEVSDILTVSDSDDNEFVWSLIESPPGAQLQPDPADPTNSSRRQFSWQTGPADGGKSYSFKIGVHDQGAQTGDRILGEVASFYVQVNGTGQPPVARADFISQIPVNTSVEINVVGYPQGPCVWNGGDRWNTEDPRYTPLLQPPLWSIDANQTGLLGSLTPVDPTYYPGKYIYQPPADFQGVDEFTYTLTNPGGVSNVAHVYLQVGDQPVVNLQVEGEHDGNVLMRKSLDGGPEADLRDATVTFRNETAYDLVGEWGIDPLSEANIRVYDKTSGQEVKEIFDHSYFWETIPAGLTVTKNLQIEGLQWGTTLDAEFHYRSAWAPGTDDSAEYFRYLYGLHGDENFIDKSDSVPVIVEDVDLQVRSMDEATEELAGAFLALNNDYDQSFTDGTDPLPDGTEPLPGGITTLPHPDNEPAEAMITPPDCESFRWKLTIPDNLRVWDSTYERVPNDQYSEQILRDPLNPWIDLWVEGIDVSANVSELELTEQILDYDGSPLYHPDIVLTDMVPVKVVSADLQVHGWDEVGELTASTSVPLNENYDEGNQHPQTAAWPTYGQTGTTSLRVPSMSRRTSASRPSGK